MTAGMGAGVLSASYSTNNVKNPAYHIVGVGPSAGIKVTAQYASSETYTIPAYIPYFFGALLLR